MAKPQQRIFEQIIVKPIEDVMHESMMPYSEYVILDRALPRVEDGLKPVQRRILYTMLELGLSPDKQHRKSARIVGDCLGKFHPHGDTSVYDAMVRMAQPFNMRMPLVDGHGNFGSIDDDPAAAMRYTEARLTPLAMELLRDLEKNTVSWSLNFDDSMKEPNILPGRYPNLLVNGASGIAVGLATNIPPHNLAEIIDGTVMLIENPSTTLSKLMQVIKGPDFPTGAFVTSGDELFQAYSTGRGKLTVRAKLSIETQDNDKKAIVITELPYQVNKSKMEQRILELRETKKEIFASIADIVDESDREGIRVVIKLRKDANESHIVANLYKYTELQGTFGVNMVAIANGKPCQMGIIEILQYYINYQRGVIVKRTQFDYDEAKQRLHIVEGLMIAIKNIDEVIRIIKSASSVSDAKQLLRARFDLSEKQAQAILDMRLAKLTKLEASKLQEEMESLIKLMMELNAILSSKNEQMNVLKNELLTIKKKFKSDRRTVVINNFDDYQLIASKEEEKNAEGIVCVNLAGLIKYFSAKHYSMALTSANDCSENELTNIVVKSDSNKTIYAFTNLGMCHKIKFNAIPEKKWREKGVTLQSLIPNAENGEKIVSIFSIGEKFPDGCIYFYTASGMVKKGKWEDYNVNKTSFNAIVLKNDELIGVEELQAETTIFFGTKNGICLNSETSDIPIQGRVAGGVKGINLNDGDKVAGAFQMDGEGEVVVVTNKGYAKRVISATIDKSARYRKGVKIEELNKDSGNEVILYCYVKQPFEIAILSDSDNVYAIDTESILIDSRTSKGKLIKKGIIKVLKAIKHHSLI